MRSNPLIPLNSQRAAAKDLNKDNKENTSRSVSTGKMKVNFDKNKTMNKMKEMLRKSESGGVVNNLNNINNKNSSKNISTVNNNIDSKLNPILAKSKFTSTLEVHNDKLKEKEELNNRAIDLLEKQNLILRGIQEENSDTEKLIKFFKEQIEQEKRKFEEMDTEEKKIKYREEILIEQARVELSDNMNKIQLAKEECFSLEAELTNKDYKLASLKQRSEEMSHKIDYVALELDDKLKLKIFKQNEFSNKERTYLETKSRIIDTNRINAEYIDNLRLIHNDLQESKGNIRVFCRVRPPLSKELKEENNASNNYIEFPNYNTIVLNGPITKSNVGKNKEIQSKDTYKFDRVFRPEDSQEEVFKEISQLVQSALDGYNVCIFAYGQTGSGKTFTMEGEDGDRRGITPRSIEQIFEFKSTLENMGWIYNVDASCVEIYNDQVRDLLMSTSNNIISQNNNKIDKFTVAEVKSVEDLNLMIETAAQKRAVAETMCNEKSSRSHCIFQLKISGRNIKTKQERQGALNLIDLAGSERVSSSKVEGDRLKETISINKSLTHLKSVIIALTSINHKTNSHIPYRDSMLTWILKDYLGGDSKTLMFVNISPLLSNFSESSCSLKFASDVNSCYLKSTEEK